MSVKRFSVTRTRQKPTGIGNNLISIRGQRGLSAIQLAKTVGVSRQTIYAMEAGEYVPNTVVALKLARALEVAVEDLFTLPDQTPVTPQRSEEAMLLPGSGDARPGQPVQLCRVGEHLIASAPSLQSWYFPVSDALVVSPGRAKGNTRVQSYLPQEDFRNRILVAGCDPGMSILGRHAQSVGIDMVLAHRNSSQSLQLLKQGSVHVAGMHLRDEASGESNLPSIQRMFSRRAVAVVTFAMWEQGIITARGNPKSIKKVEDFVRPDVSLVNREEGSGSRLLLNTQLKRLRIKGRTIRGFDRITSGHFPAAWTVRSGDADCCIATRAAAQMFGLDFIPLVSERYDLVIRREHFDTPAIQGTLDTLCRLNFRRELTSLGGYDTRSAGQRLL